MTLYKWVKLQEIKNKDTRVHTSLKQKYKKSMIWRGCIESNKNIQQKNLCLQPTDV